MRHFSNLLAFESQVNSHREANPSGQMDAKKIRIKRLREKLSGVKNRHANLDEELYTIFATSIDTNIADSQITYLERLLTELNAAQSVQVVLLTLNFNSPKYFSYWINNLARKLGTDETSVEKFERLLLEHKMINQLPREFNIAYTEKYPPLSQMIGGWLAEEMYFLERTLNLNASQPNDRDFAKHGFKLEFDMSVSQFAFLIKSFIEIGAIQNKNISELIRFLARFVKTKRSENISYESFRMKYYNVEGSTKDVVKNTLHNAIGYINRN